MAETQERKKRTLAAKDLPRTIEATVNLHKRLHKKTFKERAPRAVRAIKSFAGKLMHTGDVRIHSGLNKMIWSKGIRNVPRRIRVRMERKRNEAEEADEKMYTLVTYVGVKDLKGMTTTVVKDDE